MRPLSQETAALLKPCGVKREDRLRLTMDREGKHFVARIYSTTPSGMEFPPSRAASRTFPQRVPERRQLDGSHVWQFGATDFTTTVIAALWDREQILFDEESRTVFDYLQMNAMFADRTAQMQADFKVGGKTPQHSLEMQDGDLVLSPYQQTAAACSLDQEGYGLFMEPGTGKTAIVISRVCTEARRLWEHGVTTAASPLASAECETKIREMREAIEAMLQQAIRSKRLKLERAAQNAAAKRQVSLNYTGSAEQLLARARKAVEEAEVWLARRMAQIEDEMAAISAAARAAAERAKQTEEDVIRADARRLRPGNTAGRRPLRCLIVCPKNVRMNWQCEFEKFATVKGKVTIARGGKRKRFKALIDALDCQDDEMYTVYVVSYDILVNDLEHLKAVNWDVAALDESHYIKWPDTARAKAAIALREFCRQRMALTGTPVCNTPLDLYAQLEWLREGGSGFISWRQFRSFYGVFETTEAGYERLISVQNQPFLKERLARLSFQMSLREALPSLPEKTFDVIEVEMSKEQRALYDQVKRHLALEIERESRQRTLVVNNILTKLLRLAQITSGHVKWNAELGLEGEVLQAAEVEMLDPNPKIEELIEVLKEKGPNEKTLVWCTFVPDIKAVSARLEEEGIRHVTFYGATKEQARLDAEREFNEDPSCKVWVGNAAAGGTGLNLVGYPVGRPELADTNVTHEIYFSQNWSAVQRTQSEARGHRRGTRVPVRVSDLCVPGTIDEEIRKRVLMKRLSAADMADMKEVLKKVLDLEITI